MQYIATDQCIGFSVFFFKKETLVLRNQQPVRAQQNKNICLSCQFSLLSCSVLPNKTKTSQHTKSYRNPQLLTARLAAHQYVALHSAQQCATLSCNPTKTTARQWSCIAAGLFALHKLLPCHAGRPTLLVGLDLRKGDEGDKNIEVRIKNYVVFKIFNDSVFI